ncbi:alpha/beta fold hydrolase [Thalassotalea castellviae]|uniref:Alpha/beta fold hydrolase n=1 Tax=Thalassotalea castellviae TaxID=3075612 RepID=A0ABU3A3U0_9GAMM|nr:alpha/beta fold hydrolase [Thalassotalea sp. W431]MDT0603778.1 alpha/beta fold hydrolase [Thalassotalea sp. W431]
MTNAFAFTQEDKLSKLLTTDIADFWRTGHFSSFQGIDNKRINYASFIADQPINCLIISPGRSESYLKYQELVFDLARLNMSIFVIDHRGQGLSERLLHNPHKGYVNKFDDYTDDLHTFIETVVNPHCATNKPPLLLAHSMGGAIATRLIQKYAQSVKAVLLSSPMIAINKGGLPEWVAKSLITTGNILNTLISDQAWYFLGQGDYQAKDFASNHLMHSQIRYQTFIDLYQAQPELQLGGVTFNWLKQAVLVQQKIFADLDKISTPITIMQAGNDTIVDNSAQNKFCQQLNQYTPSLCQQSQPYVIEGAKHELLFESDKYRNQALAFIENWLFENTE